MNALLIKTTGESSFITPKNGKDFTLEELYALIGCELIEVVYPIEDNGNIFIIDEEGKLAGKIPNAAATLLWGVTGDYLAGDVIYCPSEMLK